MRAAFQIRQDGPVSYGTSADTWLKGTRYVTNDHATLRAIRFLRDIFEVVEFEPDPAPIPVRPAIPVPTPPPPPPPVPPRVAVPAPVLEPREATPEPVESQERLVLVSEPSPVLAATKEPVKRAGKGQARAGKSKGK